MRRNNNQIQNPFLIAFNQLILLKVHFLIFIFIQLFQPQNIISLVFIRIRINKGKSNGFDIFSEIEIEFQYKFLLLVHC